MTRAEVREKCLMRRSTLIGMGITGYTTLLDDFIADLDNLATSEQDTVLTLREAAQRTGYSAEYLGRLVRSGRIPNGGRSGQPRIQVKNLPPSRRSRVAKRERGRYDLNTDIQTLVRGGQ